MKNSEKRKKGRFSSTEFSKLSSQLALLRAENESWEKEVAFKEKELQEINHQLSQALERIATIEASAGWKIAVRLHSLFEKIIPENGRLGSFNRATRKTLRSLFSSNSNPDNTPPSKSSVRQSMDAVRLRIREISMAADRAEEVLVFCDVPRADRKALIFGTVSIRGWALATSGVKSVEIYLDDQCIGIANYGNFRPDVANEHPGFVSGERSGYSMEWDSTRVADGEHRFGVVAKSSKGNTAHLEMEIVVDNSEPRPATTEKYGKWIVLNESRDLLEAERLSDSLENNPKFSILMPVFNTNPKYLQIALESVVAQTYANWELCICDDGSTNENVIATLQSMYETEERVNFLSQESNTGISQATNVAMSLASGDFIVPMDSDDQLPTHALYFAAKLLNHEPETDFIYSDEDKIDTLGRRYEPFFKPDWSPDLFLSNNYLNHLTVIRTSLAKEIGGYRTRFDGSQDYDLYLRIIERTDQIRHIPKILYHWRALPTSGASDPKAKMYAHDAARRAIEDHLKRKQISADVVEAGTLGRWRVQYRIDNDPQVGIIIPTGGNKRLLEKCIRGILDSTEFENYEILILDNSNGPEVEELCNMVSAHFGKLRYVDFRNRPFNFSAMNNLAVEKTESPLVLFLNDDTLPTDPGWLGSMVEHAQRPEIGAVGAKLVFPDLRIQHAGVMMGVFSNTGHCFRFVDEKESVYFDFPNIIRNCSAVTAACLMARKEVFWQAGGFDEIHLPVAFQDVDWCLKVIELGYRIVYTPFARLIHYEGITKEEKIPNPYEVRYNQQKWAHFIANDPYYNVNLSRSKEDYSLDTY